MLDAHDTGGEAFALRDYLRVVRRRWLLILAVLTLAVGGALAYSFTQPVTYVASADVLVEPTAADISATGSGEVSSEEMATQVSVATSVPVAELVRDRLSLRTVPDLNDLVTAEVQGSSRIVRITATSTRPEQASTVANGVAAAYLEYRGTESVLRFEDAAASLSSRQRAVEDRIDVIDNALVQEPRNRIQLEAERRNLLTQLGQIASQIGAIEGSIAIGGSGGTVLQAAEVPQAPVSPKPVLNAVLALFVGLLLGIAAAVLRDRLDDVVHDEETARRALGRSPVLGQIPGWDEQANRGRLVSLMHPYSAATEAYQSLSVNVRFLLATGPSRKADRGGIVMTTSAKAGEGKTVTAANLAVAAAKVGMRVVLVDADLRRARVSERFGLSGELPGLSDLLASGDDVDSSLIDVGIDTLRLLPAGTIPPNPTELLASPRMRLILSQLASETDLVVLDTPPALLVADTLELVGAADLTLVVARRGVSHRRSVASVVERLRQLGAEAVGGVVNLVDSGNGTKEPYPYKPSSVESLPVGSAPLSRSSARSA